MALPVKRLSFLLSIALLTLLSGAQPTIQISSIQSAQLGNGAAGGGDITTGLTGWWKFDDGSTTVAVDSSGNGFDGTLSGTSIPTWTAPGKLGAYDLTFDGSTSYVNCGDHTELQAAAITIAAYVNFSSLANAYNAIVINGAGANFYQLFIKSNGKLAVYLNPVGGGVNYDGTGSTTLVTGTWYRLVVTYDSTSGLVAYVNGSVDKTVAANGTLGSTSQATVIGTDLNNAGRVPAAQIDDVRIWNRALTATDVNALP